MGNQITSEKNTHSKQTKSGKTWILNTDSYINIQSYSQINAKFSKNFPSKIKD
jgi:hypothetical protein